MNTNSRGIVDASAWWERDGLRRVDGVLTLAGRPLVELVRGTATPAFFYDTQRIRTKLEGLHAALAPMDHRVFYAMKANRFVPLLCFLRETGLVGIDACSPEELHLALACGFDESDVSYTATSVSESDLDVLARHPRVHVNCDSLSTMRRLGARCSGRTIGLRINPGVSVSYGDNPKLEYAGVRTTKFGIYRDRLDEALELANACDLEIDTIHFHVGIGLLTRGLSAFADVLEACDPFLRKIPNLRRVNVGGGLGVPHRAGEDALDLTEWAQVLENRYAGRGLQICIEPGDYVVKDSGVLVLTVNTVERKRETLFVGVDGGFNLAVEPAFYDLPCEPTPLVLRGREVAEVTLAGNVNEALDLWAEDVPMEIPREGEHIAFLNAGGYASAMASNHCMRGGFRERILRSD